MNIVIDTSVFIATILSKDTMSKTILQEVLKGNLKPQISLKLFNEYEDVLSRQDISNKSKLTKDEIEELLNALMSVSSWVEIYYLFRPNLQDEGDNHIVELAVASNSKYIITYNKKDFKQSELKFDFEVLTPQEFLEKRIKR